MQPQCNLIIDSCCDLPFEVVNRPGVELLEFTYIDSEGAHSDDLYQSITAHDFFQRMRDGEEPSTSPLSIPVLQDAFQRAIDSGIPMVFLCFSSALSGSYDVAVMVRDQLVEENPGAELYVVDTKLASVAEAPLVYEAIRQRDKGLTAKEMVAWAEEARYFVDALFMVEDLEALRRGGRIPATIAYAGGKLDVKPLLTIDAEGKLTLTGVARGRKKGLKQLADYYLKRRDINEPSSQVIIGDADCPKDVERLRELIRKGHEGALFLESSIGPVIGSHVGPGMIAVVFWGSDKREGLSVADRIARRVKGAE